LFLSVNIHVSHGEDPDKTLALVLDSAEKFFISLEERKYTISWELLSEKSHDTIITDVYKNSKKMNKNIKREDIVNDFKRKGVMFKSYWNAFSGNFDSNIILEDSRWEIGYILEDKAEILITYKKSDQPARLKMLKENNAWKIGLVETFWTRKYLDKSTAVSLEFKDFH
jgi:ABC-type Fe3+-hydroxamate transport system substrate-binding protein